MSVSRVTGLRCDDFARLVTTELYRDAALIRTSERYRLIINFVGSHSTVPLRQSVLFRWLGVDRCRTARASAAFSSPAAMRTPVHHLGSGSSPCVASRVAGSGLGI